MTLSVRFANMEWRILSRYREKEESKKFGSFFMSEHSYLFHNQMIVAIVIQSEIIADSFIYSL